MRILFISAFYPPYVIGGWEQLTRDLNERLQRRGHETSVLTSVYGVGSPTVAGAVRRTLWLESDQAHYRPLDTLTSGSRIRANRSTTRRAIAEFQPDVIFIHGMWNMTRAVAWQAEQTLPRRVVYYVANEWPYGETRHAAYWLDPARKPLVRHLKRLIAPLPLRYMQGVDGRFRPKFNRVLTVSHATRLALAQHANIPLANMQVVHNGVDTDLFAPADAAGPVEAPLRLLYAGSLVEHKGVHTIIEALAHLKRRNRLGNITLTVIGTGHPAYEQRLQRMITNAQLAPAVTFAGRVPNDAMPALMRAHDVLLLPSIWDEPLARVMQEGMASGLAVIGTLTGGSGELLVAPDADVSASDATGLTFPPENASVLADRIAQLDADRDLSAQLAHNGRAAVIARFGLTRMVDAVETALAQHLGQPA